LFDSAAVGAVGGRVIWAGAPPDVPAFSAPVSPLSEQVRGPRLDWPNPNAPHIDPASHGVGGAVVFLRGVDPRRARPWDLPAAHVADRDYQIHIIQGDADAPVGFVRRGDELTMASEQKVFLSLRGRGADFFALTFPSPDFVRRRTMEKAGVDDRPYYARTDAAGRFNLDRVPPGDYDLVCWLPDWREESRELDADTCLITRLTFRPPVEVVRRVRIETGAPATADFSVSLDAFGR
jgi:hypothetical protein